MFSFKRELRDGPEYYVISGKRYKVGRKNADIPILDDKSISHNHAELSIGDNFATISDCSKYGTFVKGIKLKSKEEVRLDDGDVIKFGVYGTAYRIKKVEICTTSSGLNSLGKQQLKRALAPINTTYVDNWNSKCTHLTAEEVWLTVKVLHALIDNKPLVKIAYWRALVDSINNISPIPKVNDFKPIIAETLLKDDSLTENSMRKQLFENKIFVFANGKVKGKMEDVIVKAGGSAISWDTQVLTLADINNPGNKQYLFVHCDDIKEIPESLKDIQSEVVKIGQRIIPIQEIAMAILLCSCEKNCNPHFDRVMAVFCKKEPEPIPDNNPLVEETQSQSGCRLEIKQEVIIPATFDNDEDLFSPPPKRQRITDIGKWMMKTPNSSDSQEPAPSTSFATVKPVTGNSTIGTVGKRKSEEVLESPAKRLVLNPASRVKKTSNASQTNPFSSLKMEVTTSSSNQFKNLDKTPPNNKENSDIGNIVEKNVTSTNSEIGSTISLPSLTKSRLGDGKWLSKSSIKGSVDHLDEELKSLYEKFKNTVQIVKMTEIPRISCLLESTSNETSTTRRNFKKFKKVQPRFPQTRIITTMPRLPPTRAPITAIQVPSGDDSDEEIRPPKTTLKNAPKKRFNF